MSNISVFETNSAKETFDLAAGIAGTAKAGDIFLLNGDLGTGKTVFAQGFAKGLGIEDYVNSPTFTIMKEYDDGRLPLYHFDVYRIGSPEEMYDLDYEEYLYGEGVCLIEWAELIEELLPDEVVKITIEKNIESGYDYRCVVIEGGAYHDNTCS